MGFVFDALKGNMFHDHPVELVTSDPASAEEGARIINTTDHGYKVYYGGVWQTLHTLTPASGIGIGYWIIGTDFIIS